MRILLFFIGFLLLIPQLSLSQWVQQGGDIDGEAGSDNFGRSVSFSADGNTVAIGADHNNGNGADSGHVRIYDFNGIGWQQRGGDIDGEAGADQSGWSVSLSNNGYIVAIGAYWNDGNGNKAGHVRVYKFNGIDWVQLGADIEGAAAWDFSGHSVSLNGNGNRIAVGAHFNDGNTGNPNDNRGHVRVFELKNGNWVQIGDSINGETLNDSSGYAVSLSNNGARVAIGTPYNDGGGVTSGHVRVFEFQGGNWLQLGADIDGEASDLSGNAVSLSADGNIVAIGAYRNNGNGNNSGHVRVFEFQGGNWTQLGDGIDGEAAGDEFGWSVCLNNDGHIVAIGAHHNDGNGNNSGHVRVYEFDGLNWIQSGVDIDGEAENDFSGHAISLSSDGSRLAVGAILNDGDNGFNSGHVRVYNNTSFLYTAIPDANFEQALINQGIDSEGLMDGQVLTLDIAGITNLDVSGEQISSLTGVEDFTALEVLNCNNNRLTSLNVSNNINLQELQCGSNKLNSLNISNNPDLNILYCARNQISGLSLNTNVNLLFLHCNNNLITGRLDLRNLALLVDVNTNGNTDLGCIQVTDPVAADAGIGIYVNWVKDPGVTYSENCLDIMAKGAITSDIKNNENSIEEKEDISIKKTLKVYPNPVQDRLYIVVPSGKTIVGVVIYNLQGEKLLETQSDTISVESLTEGLYFIGIQTNGRKTEEVYRRVIVSGR